MKVLTLYDEQAEIVEQVLSMMSVSQTHTLQWCEKVDIVHRSVLEQMNAQDSVPNQALVSHILGVKHG